MPVKAQQSNDIRVLVVDDEPAIRDLFMRTLRCSFSDLEPYYMAVSTGQEALDALRIGLDKSEPYTVAFVDLVLGSHPENVELIAEMHRLDPFLQIAIISGHLDTKSVLAISKELPADKLLFMEKPFQTRDISQAISVLGRKSALEKRINEFESCFLPASSELATKNDKPLWIGERYLHTVFNAIQDGIGVLDLEFNVVRANKALQGWYAHAMPIEGKKCYEVFQGRNEPCAGCPARLSMKSGQSHSDIVPFIGPSGPRGWIELFTFPIRGVDGNINGVVEFARDVTQRKIAEENLRISKIFLDAVNDGIVVIDLETGLFVEVNTKILEMTGYTRREMLALRALDLSSNTSEFSRAEAKSVIQRIVQGEAQLVEWLIKQKNGNLLWVEVNAKLIEFSSTMQVLASVRDISERKEAERKLLQIREALDDCGDAVVTVDRNGKATYINVAFGMLFGCTMDKAHEIDFRSYFTEPEEAGKKIAKIMAGGSWQDEAGMIDKEGRRFPAYLRGTPVLDQEYEVAAGLFILNDMSERRQLEAQVLQSQNLKSIGQLAAGIAHEINTPMQYVGDNVRFLRDSFRDLLAVTPAIEALVQASESLMPESEEVAQAREALKQADIEYLSEEIPVSIEQTLDGVGRVTEIVRAMRQFTHPGGAEKSMVDLNQAIESTITVARNEWRYVAEVATDFAPDLPLTPCHPSDFNQVVLNLMVNAAHAIADVVGDGKECKGLITVSTRRIGDVVEIRISDTGAGIPVDIRKRIFEPFFTTKDVGKGTGQGLAISRSVIVDKHKGVLTFESEEGKGTTFIIRLPLGEDASA